MATKPRKKTAKSSGKKKATKRAASKKSAKRPAKKKPVAKKKVARKAAPPKSKAKPKAKVTRKAAKKVTRKVAEKKVAKKPAKKAPVPAAKPVRKKKAKAARKVSLIKNLRPFRKALLAKQRSLLAAYNAAKGETRTDTSDGTEDYIDYAVSSYAREFSLSLTEMEQKQLQLVEGALTRITKREYGRCLNCRQPIPPKRLEVEPWARHCIRCQELEERGLLDPSDFDDDEDDDERSSFRGDEEEETEQGVGACPAS